MSVTVPENLGLLVAGAHGMLALIMGVKMTSLRVTKVPQDSSTFKLWHTSQLVTSEYTPLFIALCVGIHFAVKAAGGALRANSIVGMCLSLFGSLCFILGVTTTPKGSTGPTPLRVLGGLTRYIALGICSYEITRY
eukprot:TRINITY_DN30182_c0_g1_i1.p1 TRINITY_DN30182_c0_g1~~TRINITY_DN30182_c0_g1_i1.p1  ORF type:complete len:136 (+),score=11.36 TRINITY_DN30182_c0_g1_i1:66-473(+)